MSIVGVSSAQTKGTTPDQGQTTKQLYGLGPGGSLVSAAMKGSTNAVVAAPAASVTPSMVMGAPAVAFATPAAAETGYVAQDLPVPAGQAGAADYYTVHPGDVVSVTFRFTPEFNDEVTVGPDGRAVLKATGDITLAGRTLPEIQQEIARDSSDKLVNPEVSVSLKDFERPVVVVAGEVQTPGKFELRKPTTTLQAILMAGGPKEDSAMGHVYLFRRINSETSEVHVLQLGRYDANVRKQNDLILQPGDMILVKRDTLEKIGRFIKTFNLSVYFNPIGNNGIF
jgi:polysaccharide export outer membrane protein